jgi:hypothetical protein
MKTATRRRFLQAATAGALPLLADTAIAQDAPATADQALAVIVRLRFKHLSEDQLKAVQTNLRRGLASAEVLNRVRLDPTDEPATVFVSDVAE